MISLCIIAGLLYLQESCDDLLHSFKREMQADFNYSSTILTAYYLANNKTSEAMQFISEDDKLRMSTGSSMFGESAG